MRRNGFGGGAFQGSLANTGHPHPLQELVPQPCTEPSDGDSPEPSLGLSCSLSIQTKALSSLSTAPSPWMTHALSLFPSRPLWKAGCWGLPGSQSQGESPEIKTRASEVKFIGPAGGAAWRGRRSPRATQHIQPAFQKDAHHGRRDSPRLSLACPSAYR